MPVAAPDVDVWEGHWPALRLFLGVYGQWRMGPGGPVALDYGVIDPVARMLRLAPDERDEAFEALQVMEGEALTIIHRRAKQAMRT